MRLRFTIRDLLWLTAFTAIAVASWMAVLKQPFQTDLAQFVLTIIAAASSGAAIGALFREKAAAAAAFGLVLSFLVYFVRWMIFLHQAH